MAVSIQSAVKGSAHRTRLAATGALKLADDPFRRLVFLVVLMNISRIHQHFGFLNPLRPALTVTGLAAVYAYMNPRYLVTGSIFRTWPAKAILGLLLAACVSTPFGISMGGSGYFILTEYIKTIVFAFLVISAIRNPRDLYTMIWALVAACGALSYLSLFVFKMRRATSDGLLRIQNGYSYDSNDIAAVAVVGLALALLTLQTSKGKGKVVSFLVVAGLGATLAKTGSRGGFVGLVGFGLAMLLLVNTIPIAKRLGFLLAAGLALVIAAPPGYWDQMLTILKPTQDYNWTSPTGRKQVFERGIGYMMRNPVTGIGIDNFARAEGTISDRAMARQEDPSLPGLKWSVAHNSFLEIAAEMGMFGLSFFLLLVLGGVIGVIRLRRRIPRHWLTGPPEERFLYYCSLYLPVSYCAFIAAGSFVSFSYRDLVYALGAVTAGLFVCVEQKLKAGSAAGAVGETAVRVPSPPSRLRLAPKASGAMLLPPPNVSESRDRD